MHREIFDFLFYTCYTINNFTRIDIYYFGSILLYWEFNICFDRGRNVRIPRAVKLQDIRFKLYIKMYI